MTKIIRESLPVTFQELCTEANHFNAIAEHFLRIGQPNSALLSVAAARRCWSQASRLTSQQPKPSRAAREIYQGNEASGLLFTQANLVNKHCDRGPRPGWLGKVLDWIDRPSKRYPIPTQESRLP